MTVDERQFTPWAQAGWASWDAWSPEFEFCRFVAVMQRMLSPRVTLETGVGAGTLTGFLDVQDGAYAGFEADPRWRRPPAYPDRTGPSISEMRTADLVVLDSNPPHRMREIEMWAEDGMAGSVCIVHDCGNGHGAGSVHAAVRAAVEATGIRGVYLANPRGGWVGQHP